jgi:cytosine/adenosine deaminase-related metal-dependent hydrolase
MARAARAMRDAGTAFVADIATRSAPLAAEVLAGAGLGFLGFHEALGQGEPPAALPGNPESPLGRSAWAGHALYSTAPGVLAAAKALDNAAGLPFSLHLAEHDDEISILRDGSGPFVELMRSRGVRWDFDAPGRSPVAQAETLGLLDEKTLCVHCVKVGEEDIEILARRGCAVCLCPRSNASIGVGRAPWEKYRRAGIPLCLGTDSLASNQDLDLWAEVRFFAQGFRDPLDLEAAVALATRNPARALGLDGDYGTLAPGHYDAVSVVPPDLFNLFE